MMFAQYFADKQKSTFWILARPYGKQLIGRQLGLVDFQCQRAGG